MDRIFFGDNQFFGVNHMSEEKARQQLMRFQDINAIVDVLYAAYSAGVPGFMCTTSPLSSSRSHSPESNSA